MKKVAASEARKRWFRLLDEAARGETIVVERHGQRLVLRREDADRARASKPAVNYRRLIRVPDADEADRWSWDWRGPGRPLPARRARAR
jgi:antitoxin (DNA-binding transcriptional repressor) of toxin-antitoxin stability system